MKENTEKYQTKNPRLSYLDKMIGEKIRILRTVKKLSQRDLAKQLNISYQQFQKYESGANRMSVATLIKILIIFKIDINYFFSKSFLDEEINDELKELTNKTVSSSRDLNNSELSQILLNSNWNLSETIMLLKFYYGIKFFDKRQKILEFIKSEGEKHEN